MNDNLKKLPLMRTEEAAEYLGVSKMILCKLARERSIPATKFCNQWFFDKDKLVKFFSERIDASVSPLSVDAGSDGV